MDKSLDDKNKVVEKYIYGVRDDIIDSLGIVLPNSFIKSIIINYKDSDLKYNKLISSINNDVEAYLKEVVEEDKDLSLETPVREKEEEMINNMEQEELKNITINDTDINLMSIASCKELDELQGVINRIPSINDNLSNYEDLDIEDVKKEIFNKYRDSIPKDIRDIGNLGLHSIDEYKELANNINDKYTSITIDNGDGNIANYDKNINTYKEHVDLDKESNDEFEIDTNLSEDLNIMPTKGFIEMSFDEENRKADLFAMTEDGPKKLKDNQNVKVLKMDNKQNKDNPSNSGSEKGYSDTLNLVLSVVSFVTIILLMILYFITN